MTWTANGSLLAYGNVPLFAVDLWACVGRERERDRKKETEKQRNKASKKEQKKARKKERKDNKG